MSGTIICVDACLIKRENRDQFKLSSSDEILLLHRKSTGFMDNTFCLPGGKPLDNEMPQNAMLRELFEELGISVDLANIVYAHTLFIQRSPRNYLSLVFRVDEWTGEIVNKESEKHDYFNWFKLNALPENLMSGHRQALMHILQNSYYSELKI